MPYFRLHNKFANHVLSSLGAPPLPLISLGFPPAFPAAAAFPPPSEMRHRHQRRHRLASSALWFPASEDEVEVEVGAKKKELGQPPQQAKTSAISALYKL